jgi:hypothetical protein
MDMNSVTLAGNVKRAGIKESRYPFGWAMIELPALLHPADSAPIVEAHHIFVGFNVKGDRDRAKMAELQNGGWATIFDATLTSRPIQDQPGKERRGVQGSLFRTIVTPQVGQTENVVLLHGRVEGVHGTQWIRLGCSYMNPRETDPQKKWKSRNITLYVPGGVGNLGVPAMQQGRSYYVRGRVVGLKPKTNDEDVVVVADLVNG